MRVLITNDDGVDAEGLRSLHRAISVLDGVDARVIAPAANQSGKARSITTRAPLAVSEVELDDGSIGHAVEGTPVDCVRFADLGLIGERPEMILSGINHGANLGDDITYSGTVAAAFEGIVLGIPAIAISQQSAAREMDFRFGRSFDFTYSAGIATELVRNLAHHPLPPGTLLNVNCPGTVPIGIEVAKLGKRIYDDELRLVSDDGVGNRAYELYGYRPDFEDEPGTDLVAVSEGRISLTPVHFDLTDADGIDRLCEWDLEALSKALAGAAG